MSLSTDSNVVNTAAGDIETGGPPETEEGKKVAPTNTESNEESLDATQIDILSNAISPLHKFTN